MCVNQCKYLLRREIDGPCCSAWNYSPDHWRIPRCSITGSRGCCHSSRRVTTLEWFDLQRRVTCHSITCHSPFLPRGCCLQFSIPLVWLFFLLHKNLGSNKFRGCGDICTHALCVHTTSHITICFIHQFPPNTNIQFTLSMSIRCLNSHISRRKGSPMTLFSTLTLFQLLYVYFSLCLSIFKLRLSRDIGSFLRHSTLAGFGLTSCDPEVMS